MKLFIDIPAKQRKVKHQINLNQLKVDTLLSTKNQQSSKDLLQPILLNKAKRYCQYATNEYQYATASPITFKSERLQETKSSQQFRKIINGSPRLGTAQTTQNKEVKFINVIFEYKQQPRQLISQTPRCQKSSLSPNIVRINPFLGTKFCRDEMFTRKNTNKNNKLTKILQGNSPIHREIPKFQFSNKKQVILHEYYSKRERISTTKDKSTSLTHDSGFWKQEMQRILEEERQASKQINI